jgi:branched-subunit amino acid aminotransferase/4-amino-4-deoxychorismate lyase
LPDLTWVNGSFVSSGEACLEAGERGFLFGDGLFETVRLYAGAAPRGRPARAPVWPRHAARLAEGCRALGIPYPLGWRRCWSLWRVPPPQAGTRRARGESLALPAPSALAVCG